MNNTNKLLIKLAMSLVALATGCGDSEETPASSPTGMAAEAIVGTWESECLTAGDLYEKKSIEFTEKAFFFSSSVLTDSKCLTVVDEISGYGEYALGAVVPVQYVGNTTAIDYTFRNYIWTFVDEPADAVDFAKACGDASYDGDQVDVLGKTCKLSDESTIQFHSPAYGVVILDDDGKLLLTDASSNGGSEEERSTSLRINAGWTKKEETQVE